MTIGELLLRLEQARQLPEGYAHLEADNLLIAFINHPDVTAAFDAIDKKYGMTS